MPAILVELAFIDSPAVNPDVGILRDRRREMVATLEKGILEHLGKEAALTPCIDQSTEGVNTVQEPRFNTLAEVPDWGKATVQKLIQRGAFAESVRLDLSLDMLRLFVVHDRIGVY
jgi:hypothetical protein